jgi:hypothetical protein
MPKPRGGHLPLKKPNPDSRIARCEGWGLYQIKPQPQSTSPLWVFVKAFHDDRADERRSPHSGRRSYRLRWGVDKGRFAGEAGLKQFRERFPTVAARFEAECREFYTVAKAEHEMRYQGIDPAGERARLLKSETKGAALRAAKRQRTSGKSVREGEV